MPSRAGRMRRICDPGRAGALCLPLLLPGNAMAGARPEPACRAVRLPLRSVEGRKHRGQTGQHDRGQCWIADLSRSRAGRYDFQTGTFRAGQGKPGADEAVAGWFPAPERSRASGPERLREIFSSMPWHALRVAKDRDCWNALHGSRAAWQGKGVRQFFRPSPGGCRTPARSACHLPGFASDDALPLAPLTSLALLCPEAGRAVPAAWPKSQPTCPFGFSSLEPAVPSLRPARLPQGQGSAPVARRSCPLACSGPRQYK